jgi:hypothetical protein
MWGALSDKKTGLSFTKTRGNNARPLSVKNWHSRTRFSPRYILPIHKVNAIRRYTAAYFTREPHF